MAEDLTEAISFVKYAGLVDGIFPGLKNQLAKDVVLQWFGETFKGNKYVTSFMCHDNKDIFHTFIEIVPSSGIKKKLQERCKPSTNKCSSDETKINDYTRSDINVELELEEEMKSASKSIQKKHHLAENDTMKYIEAKGEVVFKWKETISSIKPTWSRRFRLQIAYSYQMNKKSMKFYTLENELSVGEHSNITAKKQCNTLPKAKNKLSKEEILRSNLDAYYAKEFERRITKYKSSNSTEDRANFSEQFESEIIKNSIEYQPFLRYMSNLTSKYQSRTQKKQPINYQVHRIIYESLE